MAGAAFLASSNRERTRLRYRFPEEGIPLQNRHHRGEEAGGMDCRGEPA